MKHRLDEIKKNYFGSVKLQKLLKLVQPNVERDELYEVFQAIADCMLSEVRIRKGGKLYDILEIEFYYRSPHYKYMETDTKEWKVTYPRKAQAGDWFFHSYGVDLCFDSCPDGAYYGGILIRSIKEASLPTSFPILGPGKVCDLVFSVYNAFENVGYEKNMPRIILKDDEFHATVSASTMRYHIADIIHNVTEQLRFTVAQFEDYSKCCDTKEWRTYFAKERIGQTKADAEHEINKQP